MISRLSMYRCTHCGKRFTRKDNVVRHINQVCNSSKHVSSDADEEQDVATSMNDNAVNIADFVSIITSEFREQRRRWKKDFNKFKKEIKPPDNTENMISSDDEDIRFTNEENSYAD